MRLGFRHTAFQAVCTVLVLCFALGLLERADTVQPVFGEDSVRVPILMYHSILRDSARQGKYVISPAVLAADLDALQEKGYTAVTVSDLLAYVQDGADLPEKPVMLKQRGMKAVVSIIGSQTALFTDNGEENAYWSHLRLDRLREMQDVFEVQNHSWNLHEYGERRGCLRRRGEDETRYETLLRKDTEQTQKLITDAGLPTPTCYTSPFGACSKESETLLKSMGFRCTLGCEERVNTVTRNPDCLFELGRFNRPAGQSTESFLHRALGED